MSARYRRPRHSGSRTSSLGNSGHNDPNNVWGSGLNQQGWENAWTNALPKPKAATPKPGLTPDAQPFDPVYNDEIGLNRADLDTSLAQIEYGRGQVAQEYGFDASGGIDMSNPYSRAGLLERSFHQGQRGTLNSMAGAGQLYSGATQRNLDEGTFRHSRDYDTLRRGAQGAYFDLTNQEQGARSTYSRANLDADRDRLDRAKENRPEDPGPYAGINFSDLDRLIKAQKPKKKRRPKGSVFHKVASPNPKERLG